MNFPERSERVFNRINQNIGRRRASGEANRFSIVKPFSAQVAGLLNVMDTTAETRAGSDEFACVVAVRAADDNDHIALPGEFDGGGLALLGGLADSVAESDFRLWKLPAHESDQLADALNGLGGLRDDTEASARLESGNVVLGLHHGAAVEIASQAAHFHMIAPADNNRMETVANQFTQRAMSEVNEGAGGFQHIEALLLQLGTSAVGSAVRSNHDGVGLCLAWRAGKANSSSTQIVHHGFVVNEVAKDRDTLLVSRIVSQGDGIPHAETHSKVSSAQDSKRRADY